MPHKKNPILCERLCGMARLLRGYVTAAYEDVALWHERDISHSSAERVILPDATTLLDYMLSRMQGILEDLHVYPQAMDANLDKTRGLIYSQQALLALTRAGLSREDAYALVQSAAMRCWAGEGDFLDLLAADRKVTRLITKKALAKVFDPKPFLVHVDEIFDRVFE